jgi:hypothetical protein
MTCKRSIDGVDLEVTALTNLLAEVSDRLVIFVEDNAHLVHQSNLLFIVAIQFRGAGVDIGEEAQNTLGCNGLSPSNGSGCRHFREEKEEGVQILCAEGNAS